MTWYAVYDINTGELFSQGNVIGDIQAPLAYVQLEAQPDDTMQWDPTTHSFIAIPPEILIDRMQDYLSNPQFLALQEVYAALNVDQQAAVTQFIESILGSKRYRRSNEPFIPE